MILRATIPGEPIGKGRPRLGRGGRTYTPEKTAQWEKMAAQAIALQIRERGLDEPLALVVDAYFTRPVKHGKRRRATREPKPTKPDADNIAKAVADALEKSGVVVNDSRIAHLVVRKWWVGVGEHPRVDLALSRLT